MSTIQDLLRGALPELKVPNAKTLMEKATGFLGNRTVQLTTASVVAGTVGILLASNLNFLSGSNQSTELMLHPTANPAPVPSLDLSSLSETVFTIDLNKPLREAVSLVKSVGLFKNLQASAFAETVSQQQRAATSGSTKAAEPFFKHFESSLSNSKSERDSLFSLFAQLPTEETLSTQLPLEEILSATATLVYKMYTDLQKDLFDSSATNRSQTSSIDYKPASEVLLAKGKELYATIASKEVADSVKAGLSQGYSKLESFGNTTGEVFSTMANISVGILSVIQKVVDVNSYHQGQKAVVPQRPQHYIYRQMEINNNLREINV